MEKGPYLEIRPNGSKYWHNTYRFVGKEKLPALGVYTETILFIKSVFKVFSGGYTLTSCFPVSLENSCAVCHFMIY
ncbi:MAG: hypothetical protein CMN56_07265 [Sneathiella sp.]|nr:hypothetical protein [Sneathiella sp.]